MSDRQYSELTRLISQMIREIGEFKANSETGLAHLNERLDKLEGEVKKRFDGVDEQFEKLEYSLKIMTSDLMKARSQVERVDSRVRRLEGETVVL